MVVSGKSQPFNRQDSCKMTIKPRGFSPLHVFLTVSILGSLLASEMDKLNFKKEQKEEGKNRKE